MQQHSTPHYRQTGQLVRFTWEGAVAIVGRTVLFVCRPGLDEILHAHSDLRPGSLLTDVQRQKSTFSVSREQVQHRGKDIQAGTDPWCSFAGAQVKGLSV